MAVKVSEPHSLSIDEAKNRVLAFESFLAEKGVKALWKGNSATIKGPMGVGGSIDITASSVDVEVKIPMIARAVIKEDKLSASIRKRLRAKLDGE